MKKTKITGLLLILFIVTIKLHAQSAEEVVERYYDAIGGLETWSSIQGLKFKSEIIRGERRIPMELVFMKDGRRYVSYDLDTMEFKTGVFNGEVLWGVNLKTKEPELMDENAAKEMKENSKDFHKTLFNYASKGYKLSWVGEETIDSIVCNVVQLSKKIKLNEEENIKYYFDKQTELLIMQEEPYSGEGPKFMQTKYSSYKKVGNISIPFFSQEIIGERIFPMEVIGVEINPKIEDHVFNFPVKN